MSNSNLWGRQLFFTPLGGQTLSKLPSRYVDGVYPKLLAKGYAGHVVDTDGKDYIDYISGLGSVSVGYCNQYINNAIKEQMEKGITLSLPTTLEADVSEKLCALMPKTEMWKFGKNGVDATLMALRCARAFTARTKVMVHGYHGCSDHFESLGTRKAGMLDLSAHVQKYDGNLDFSDRSFAALIVEPQVFEHIDWHRAAEWCAATGTLLIFDEIVTAGRYKAFTAHEEFGITPDLITIGKGVANGMPFSAVGGRHEVMKTFERDDFFASTTFGGECLSLAACLATLNILQEHRSKIIEYGEALQRIFNNLFEPFAHCEGYPSRTQFVFPTTGHKALFWQECVKEGVLFGYSNFPMVEHTKEDLIKTIAVMKAASLVVKEHWNNPQAALEGGMPVEALRLSTR